MLRKLNYKDFYLAKHGWLTSRFHFSFAEYRNINNINYGVLRVLNDDIIAPSTGFDTHPHSDMEIITYVIDGELTHKDSMGNEATISRGEVQYMSAGDGIFHSEYNNHPNKELRLLQIWILPPKRSLPSLYGEERYTYEQRHNKLLNVVSSQSGESKVKIYQDINMYVSELDKSKELEYKLDDDRQIYFVLIEGSVEVNDMVLTHGDALEISEVANVNIKALKDSHFLFIEMISEK